MCAEGTVISSSGSMSPAGIILAQTDCCYYGGFPQETKLVYIYYSLFVLISGPLQRWWKVLYVVILMQLIIVKNPQTFVTKKRYFTIFLCKRWAAAAWFSAASPWIQNIRSLGFLFWGFESVVFPDFILHPCPQQQLLHCADSLLLWFILSQLCYLLSAVVVVIQGWSVFRHY